MLVVLGIASLVISALLIVVGRATFTNSAASQSIRNFANSATYHVFLATLAGMGVVMVLLFIAGSASLGALEIGLSVAIAVGGGIGVRMVHRKHGWPTKKPLRNKHLRLAGRLRRYGKGDALPSPFSLATRAGPAGPKLLIQGNRFQRWRD